jgi:hypothetical protein
MAFNTKDILRDGKGKPIPQFYDEYADAFKPLGAPNGGNAQEPFKGETDYTHTFSKPMTGFVIKNSGIYDIDIIINNYTFTVEAGESFEDTFYPFTEVKIRGNSKFKAYGKGSGGIATFVIIDEFFAPRADVANISPSTNSTKKYKASMFKMNKTKVLRTFGLNANASLWELWTINANNSLATKVKSGTFTGAKDGVYNKVILDTPITLTSGTSYAILFALSDTSPSYNFMWNKATSINQPSLTYPITTDSMTITGYSLQSETMPAVGDITALTQNFVYDFKLGLADK